MDKKLLEQKIGSEIRKIRIEKGLSQEDLSTKALLHRTYIGMVERGEKNLTISSLHKVLTALGLSFVTFFKRIDESKS